MFTIDTKASGYFKIYDQDFNLIGDTSNIITDVGLDNVADRTWADSFKHLVAGFGSTAPSASDTFLNFNLLLSSTTYLLNPAAYTLATWDALSGMTYSLGRWFKLTNYTASSVNIQDIGTSPNLSATNYLLFSKAKLTNPFTLAASSFVYVLYELRLRTLLSTTVSQFQVDYNSSYPSHALPTNRSGVITLPFATLSTDGSVVNNSFATGQGIFEPSNTTNYLYKFGSASPTLTGYFADKRAAFEQNPLITLNSTLTAVGATHPTLSTFGVSTTVNQLTSEGNYVPGSFERRRHLIMSPVITPATEKLWGIGISSSANATIARDTGWQVVFSSEYTRPPTTFFKMFVRQSWGRA